MTEIGLQAQRIAEAIENEKLCEDPDFRRIVDHYRTLKLIQGRLVVIHDNGGIRVEPVIWSQGYEQILLDAIKKA